MGWLGWLLSLIWVQPAIRNDLHLFEPDSDSQAFSQTYSNWELGTGSIAICACVSNKSHVHPVAKIIPPSGHVASVSIVKANPLDTQRY